MPTRYLRSPDGGFVPYSGGGGTGGSVTVDETLSVSGAAADAKVAGEKISKLSEAIAKKLDKSGGTLGGKFVIPTADTTAGFVNSEDMKIFGYGTDNFRMGDPNKPLELRGSGTNPMFGSKKILVEGDVTGGLLTVETIVVDDGGETVPVTGVTLDYTSLSLNKGDIMQLAAMVTPSNATNSAVLWETSDGNVATVSEGLVTANAEGNAVITAKSVESPSIKATCAVSVAADDGGETEVTLSRISATYSGGDVAVGTAVTELTGIVVTAHYSDGSSVTVTDYTLSGEIVEGSNTITVNYVGKTTTFTVTGIAESNKIRFTTLDWQSGTVKPNGSTVSLNNMYYVEIPYTDGMYVKTFYGQSTENSGYRAILILKDGVYTVPEYTYGDLKTLGDMGMSNIVDATLTGYETGSTVVVNFITKTTNVDKIEEHDILYYIPGGDA